MLNTYTASPTKIDRVDFSKIGSGVGTLRHAFGMHFGEFETAKHYLDGYQGHTEAGNKFTFDGESLSETSPGYMVAQFIFKERADRETTVRRFDGFPILTEQVNLLWPEDEPKPLFDVVFGELYKVSIPDLEINDITKWDDQVPEDAIHDFAEKALDILITQDELNEVDWASLNVDPVDKLPSELFDELYNNAVKDAQDNAMDNGDDFDVDLDELKKSWDATVRNDTHSSFEVDVDDHLSGPQLSALKALVKGKLNFVIQPQPSYGDLYNNLAPISSDEFEGKKIASSIFVKAFAITALRAPAMYGNRGSMEVIILDEELLQKAKFEPISEPNLYMPELSDNAEWEDDYSFGMR
jgi:hypothetical protein